MTMKNFLVSVYAISMILTLNVYAKEQQVLDLTWEDLVPEDYVFMNPLDKLSDEEYYALVDDSEQAQEIMAEIKQLMDFAPVVDKLDGKTVRISGYAVPLDFDAQKVREFLLVPYFGACIHTPPPPANQVVHGTLESSYEIKKLFEPVWITGKIKTIRDQQTLGESGFSQSLEVETGYTMEVETVTPYREEG